MPKFVSERVDVRETKQNQRLKEYIQCDPLRSLQQQLFLMERFLLSAKLYFKMNLNTLLLDN